MRVSISLVLSPRECREPCESLESVSPTALPRRGPSGLSALQAIVPQFRAASAHERGDSSQSNFDQGSLGYGATIGVKRRACHVILNGHERPRSTLIQEEGTNTHTPVGSTQVQRCPSKLRSRLQEITSIFRLFRPFGSAFWHLFWTWARLVLPDRSRGRS
jgi:hypothetical protein